MTLSHPSTPRARRLGAVQGALIVCFLCVVAILPLLHGRSPCTHDGRLHFFRVAAMRDALDRGIVFSRWLPNLAFGYGFPFFNYRAPVSYYLTLGLHLTGLSLPWALNLVYVLSIVGSALGAYLLGRDLFGPWAGVVTGVAYAYAPYQFLDALVRGNAPEVMALALLPFILWAFRRLLIWGGRWWFLVAILLLATLYLTHNISALLFTPFLLAYIVLLAAVYRGRAQCPQVILALALALALTTFFWLPALAEGEYVQLYLTGATRNNDFHYNFLTLAEVLAPPEAFDTSLMNPPLKVRLGAVHALLAVVGLIRGWSRLWRPRRQGQEPENPLINERWVSLLFFAGLAVLSVFMSLSWSVWFWEHVPLLPFVQFPWRFVGRASLPLALLVGAATASPPVTLPRSRRNGSRVASRVLDLLPPIAVVALVLAAFPSTYPPKGYCSMASYPNVQDVHRYEGNSGLVGVDPVGAYFPIWVEQRPHGSPLVEQHAEDQAVARFDARALPDGAQILESVYGPNRARILVESPEPFRARYLSFYFPGWRVWVDGEQVDLLPSEPEGLITFQVPGGRHQVEVRFGETPLRMGSDAISVLALFVLFWSTIRMKASHAPLSSRDSGRDQGRLRLIGLLSVILLLPMLKVVVVDRMDTPFRHPDLREEGTLPGLTHPLHQPYADGLRLIGYEKSTDGRSGSLPTDDTLRVDLYWAVQLKPDKRYQTVIRLVGPDGFLWSPKDSFRPTDFEGAPPTTAWEPGRYALDSHEVEPLPGTPPGQYDIVLIVFDRDTLQPLPMLTEQGQPGAPELVLGQVLLGAPRADPEPEDLQIQHRIDECLGSVTLLGGNLSRDEAAPGDPLLITSFWQVEANPGQELALHLQLLAADGSVAAGDEFPLTVGWHPTTAWQADEVWRGQHLFHLPATIETGTYTLALSLSHLPSRVVSLSQVFVVAPDRAYTRPPVDVDIDVSLGDVVILAGVDMEPQTAVLRPGEAFTVSVVWRAEATVEISYRAFVHLIGPGGELVAQSDAVPGGWARPTTGWLPGEYVLDVHRLVIPPDAPGAAYALRAGLYDPRGGRLTAPDGAESVRIMTVTLEPSE